MSEGGQVVHTFNMKLANHGDAMYNVFILYGDRGGIDLPW